MKTILLLGIFLIITGCSFGSSKQVQTAENILTQFECKNIDNDQLTHNPITGFHQRTLYISKEKAEAYIENFKAGETLIEMPLEQMVEQQYLTFKSACQYLGGVTTETESEETQQQQ